MDLGDQCAEYVCIGILVKGSKFGCCGGQQQQRLQITQSQSTADLGFVGAEGSGRRWKGHSIGQFAGALVCQSGASMIGDI
ncbi:MAG: Uncharacterised protein [Flavobacteriia bacterium]|nr:MAG: Uncharacterised protein [Flavobacteriia bacterium]